MLHHTHGPANGCSGQWSLPGTPHSCAAEGESALPLAPPQELQDCASLG
mgnify:CR=1 FL=1|jgi:hypothetical protein